MTEDLMSLDIFEFEDPGTHPEPIMRLRQPWRLNATLVQDEDVVALVEQAQTAADTAQAAAEAAAAAASDAQQTADGKIETFWQDTEPATGAEGDIWFDTNDNNKVYRRTSGAWVLARDSGIAAAVSAAATAQGTADGKAKVYFQATAPTGLGAADQGDLWVDTDDHNKLWAWTGTEFVIAQDWYAANSAATAAQANADTAIANAAAAQSTADTAVTNAATANAAIADIASDAKLTPVEKSAIRTEWDVVAAEKTVNDSQAGAFAVSRTAYDAAFQALATYLNNGTTWSSGVPTWIADANLGTTTTIVGATFRTNWKSYYDARTALLNAIAAKAKTLADAAQTAANAAQGTANTAVTNAAAAQTTANAATKSWAQAAAPTIGSRPNAINGDRWIDTDDGNREYLAIAGVWVATSSVVPGGTTTPVAPTVSFAVAKRTLSMEIVPQANLINPDGWDIQISRDNTNWYCPNLAAKVDADGWYTGALNGFLKINSPSFRLPFLPIPTSGTPALPAEAGQGYYLRVRARCSSPAAQSGWTTSAILTVLPVLGVDFAAAQVVAALIAAGAVDMTKLSSGIRPTRTVAALPANPYAGYALGDTVVLTTDGKIYRMINMAGAGTSGWTASVAAADISGQLAAAQIAALEASKITGQLTDAQLAAIAAAKITGTLGSTQIADDAITTPKLAAGAVTAAEIGALAVIAGKIAAGAVTATELAAGSVIAGKIAAGAIQTNDLAAGAVTTAKLAALAVTANELAADAVTAAKIQAGAVGADEIAANAVTAAKILAGAIQASKLSVLARNYVNNPTLTGNVNGWGAILEDGSGTSAITSYDATEKALKITSAGNHAVRGAGFEIDHSKIYKIVARVKKSAASGVVYVGLAASASAISAYEGTSPGFLDGWMTPIDPVTRIAGTATNNFYPKAWASGSSPVAYETVTFYVLGAYVSIDEMPKGISGYTCTQLAPTTNYLALRFLNWSNSVSTNLFIRDISVSEVGAGTIVAENIFALALSAITANLGEITAGKMYSVDYDPGVAGFVIDLDAGEIHSESGGWSIFSDGTVEFNGGTIGGISFDATKLFVGAGNWGNADTPAYLDKDGFFSLLDKIKFDPTTNTLTIKSDALETEEGGGFLNHEGRSLVWRDTALLEKARIIYDASLNLLKANPLGALVEFKGSWIYGTWQAASVVIASSCDWLCGASLADGNLLICYRNNVTSKLVFSIREPDGTLTSPVVVVDAATNGASLVALSDGSCILFYTKSSTQYIYQKTRDSGGTWGGETTLVSEATTESAAVALKDSSCLLVYVKSAGVLCQRIRNSSGLWGNESVISTLAWEPALGLLLDGRVLLTYGTGEGATNDIAQRIREIDGSWGSEAIVNSFVSWGSSLVVAPDGRAFLFYQRGDNAYIDQRIRETNGTWGPATTVVNAATGYPLISSILPDGKILLLCLRSSDNNVLQLLNNSAYTAIPLKTDYCRVGAGIEEIGSNSNGSYIKFSDGTLICYGRHTNATYPQILTYPWEFLDTTYALLVLPATGANILQFTERRDDHLTTGAKVWLFGNGAAWAVGGELNWFAFGRWK